MRPAIEFSTKHNIKPHLTLFKLEDLPEMVEIMVSWFIDCRKPTLILIDNSTKIRRLVDWLYSSIRFLIGRVLQGVEEKDWHSS
jgi:hypothetical protein